MDCDSPRGMSSTPWRRSKPFRQTVVGFSRQLHLSPLPVKAYGSQTNMLSRTLVVFALKTVPAVFALAISSIAFAPGEGFTDLLSGSTNDRCRYSRRTNYHIGDRKYMSAHVKSGSTPGRWRCQGPDIPNFPKSSLPDCRRSLAPSG
jgi:hypothetical protein